MKKTRKRRVTFWARLLDLLAGERNSANERRGMGDGLGGGPGGGIAQLFGRSAEMMDVADEVATEQRGRVLILDHTGDYARWLLAQLREQPPVPAFADVAREGFFSLIRLETEGDALHVHETESAPSGNGDFRENGHFANHHWPHEDPYRWRGSFADPDDPFGLVQDEAMDADLILYLCAGVDGWTDAAARLYARLRALTVPVLPIALLSPASADPMQTESFRRRLRQWTGVEPVMLEIPEDPAQGASQPLQNGLRQVIDGMLSLRPRLAVPLAQEVPSCRRLIAARVIRTGALMTGLIGTEPIPLLDLPLHVAVQWKVAMQLAAIFGRPGLDVRSKEMASTVGLSLLVRYIAQQLLKLLPGIGFLLSGVLSGLSTLLLGHALLRYYEESRLVNWQAARAVVRDVAAVRVRASVASGKAVWQKTAVMAAQQRARVAERLHISRHAHRANTATDAATTVQEIPIVTAAAAVPKEQTHVEVVERSATTSAG